MTNEKDKVPERIWYCTERQVSVPAQFDAACDIAYVPAVKVAEARRSALLAAAKDVCMYCDGRALGYEPAAGPNPSGNYTHEAQNKAHLVTTRAKGIVLCAASTIHARIKFEAAENRKGEG